MLQHLSSFESVRDESVEGLLSCNQLRLGCAGGLFTLVQLPAREGQFLAAQCKVVDGRLLFSFAGVEQLL